MSSWNVCPRRLLKLLDMNSRKKILTKGIARTRYCSHSYVSGVSDCLLRVVFFCKFSLSLKKKKSGKKSCCRIDRKSLIVAFDPLLWRHLAAACHRMFSRLAFAAWSSSSFAVHCIVVYCSDRELFPNVNLSKDYFGAVVVLVHMMMVPSTLDFPKQHAQLFYAQRTALTSL